jgi:hypothetical protein
VAAAADFRGRCGPLEEGRDRQAARRRCTPPKHGIARVAALGPEVARLTENARPGGDAALAELAQRDGVGVEAEPMRVVTVAPAKQARLGARHRIGATARRRHRQRRRVGTRGARRPPGGGRAAGRGGLAYLGENERYA